MKRSIADDLLSASDNVENLSHSHLQALLRRAALRIQNVLQDRGSVVLDADILDLVQQIAADSEIDKNTTVNALLRDWLVSHQMMPADIGKETETKGSA